MHEEPELTADPLAEKLGRFTPDLTGLDRDALLFQAGRASAGRQRRLWPALAGLLALSHAATLLFLVTRTESTPTVVVIRTISGTRSAVQAGAPSSPSEPTQWSYRRAAMTGDIDDLPPMKKVDAGGAPPNALTVLSTTNLPPLE
jgi:hypothetical protein